MHFISANRINCEQSDRAARGKSGSTFTNAFFADKIHGGPMAGRVNYQAADYQCIRPGELWQCNWLEETGTICSLVYDIPNKKITTLLGFSAGHWNNPEKAHGDKRNPEDLERGRALAKEGKSQADRKLLHDQAKIAENFKGLGDLQDVDESWPTL